LAHRDVRARSLQQGCVEVCVHTHGFILRYEPRSGARSESLDAEEHPNLGVHRDPLAVVANLRPLRAVESRLRVVEGIRRGKYLALTFQIVEGEYRKRQLWHNLNMVNKNEIAVKIAKAELSSICRAVDVMTPQDSGELHNLPMTIEVTTEKREWEGRTIWSNDVKTFKGKGVAQGQPQQAANEGPAWAR